MNIFDSSLTATAVLFRLCSFYDYSFKMSFYKITKKSLGNILKTTSKMKSPSKTFSSQISSQELEIPEPEQIKIPVPWGHIAAARWGNNSKKPILAMHGWQDNAYTWKPLIPYLSKDIDILAIDFPGHGWSSHFPPGMTYGTPDFLLSMRRVIKYFGWESVPMIGHSMGAILISVYSSLFPKEIDFTIHLDNIKPVTSPLKYFYKKHAERIESILEGEERSESDTMTSTLDELKQRMHDAGVIKKSIPLDKCHILLERAVRKSPNNPDQYYVTRDRRIKQVILPNMPLSDITEMVKRHNAPTLFVRFDDSVPFDEDEVHEKILNIYRAKDNFEEQHMPGTHHGHIVYPHVLGPLINNFVAKHSK